MTDRSRNDDYLASPYQIALSNQQSRHPIDEAQLTDAASAILQDSAYSSAAISLAVVDDKTIHELNRRHLEHDWPTDVLSFVLEDDGDYLEGEVIVSADTAAAAADEHGHSAAEEQLLYLIHGMLHLVGYDDKTDENALQMRAAEAHYLQQLGAQLSRRAAP